MRKKILILVCIVLAGAGALAVPRAIRLYHVIHLFDTPVIADNFRDMKSMFEYREVHRAGPVLEFIRDEQPLPESFVFEGKSHNVRELIERTGTTGLVVIKGNRILHESYYLGNTASSKAISWSVGKSFVSALVGHAVQEGRIASIQDPVTRYLPELKECGYNGVPIKDLLNMSSGIRFNEDYGDFNSDINRMGRTLALRTSMKDFILTLKSERPPGQFRHYVSMDAQVLGMLVAKVTGKSLSQYLEEKIWQQAGMESDAYWLVDSTGMELAFGTLNVTLRDFARFGVIYRNGGKSMGRQIVPAAWVTASVTPDAPHLKPGKNPLASTLFGYGYQWWIPPEPEGDFLAIGVYNQFIYVNPKRDIVIAKTSAHPSYTKDMDFSEYQTTAMFQAIARKMGR